MGPLNCTITPPGPPIHLRVVPTTEGIVMLSVVPLPLPTSLIAWRVDNELLVPLPMFSVRDRA